MEVSGKRKPKKTLSLSRGSAEDFLLFCIPCDRDGARVPAKGYCSTCKEHLCDTCYKHHKKQTPSRHHILLDQDSMPTTSSVPIVKDEFDSCDDHEDEKLKFFCRDHDTVVCSVCTTLDHRTCNVEYIPKLSKYIIDSEELNETMTEMKALENNYKSQIKRVNDEIKAISQNHDDVIKAIRQFRKEINTRLDKMEKRVVKEADHILLKQQTNLNDLSKEVQTITNELVEKQVRLHKLIQKHRRDKLFVEMIDAKKRLEEMRVRQKQHSLTDDFQTVSFVKNMYIVDVIDRHQKLGELIAMNTSMVTQYTDKTLKLEVVEDINSSSLGEKISDITGMDVLQSDKMVVCEFSKRKVKCFDTVQKRIISEIQLSKSPFDLAAITNDKFVVTVPDERSIHFMSLTNRQITSDLQVNINERCHGIACSRDKIVVSCIAVPGKVLVLDLHGKILQSLSGDNSLFSLPYYIVVNSAGTSIYVSDRGNPVMAVKQFDWQGNDTNTYQPTQDGENIRDICELDDGTFLVCMNQDSGDNLRRVSDNCKPCKITINEKLGNWYPKAVAYCRKTRKLYVSYHEKMTPLSTRPKYRIKVFSVDWC
ncbi:uncharacterized protein LOC132724104 [Ruditapes philippinarum]|uniref:uncharacterized protein LOC132724104 n=1 Tax=Ruditapes philippinarum TaxID=129788 RepID=UPI00295A8DAA|nr:uncharacterized protein LOC132724104 [Ruditapes philippinarum]